MDGQRVRIAGAFVGFVIVAVGVAVAFTLVYDFGVITAQLVGVLCGLGGVVLSCWWLAR